MRTKLVNKDIRDNYVIELLKERGLNEKEIDYFLNVPDDRYLQSPEALMNIDLMAEHFEHITHLSSNERIIVVVDSDCDGFASGAIFIQYVRKFNPDVQIEWILHKGKGHGLSDTIEEILDKQNENPNIRYVILPDSSSNDCEYHERLGAENIFSLILDHHIVEPDTQFSDWAVIVNNQLSPHYTNKDLCGGGVVWQFCRYYDNLQGTSY